MSLIKAFLDLSETLIGFVCVVLLAAMFALGVTEVFCRYVVEYSLSFPSELIRFLFVWSVFLGSALAVRKNSHAAIELFVGWLPNTLGKAVIIFSLLLSAVFFAVLVVKGYDVVLRVGAHKSPAMRLPMSYPYAAIPVGAAFMLLYTLEVVGRQLAGPSDTKGEIDESTLAGN
ncbi:TRAP transporter small permease [Castellaniella sp. GW247-6E4]|uniref:TRAP transporter small permease n=1 Tax=Castellaniella sp. GW247-6E4 TaxID=3140380 RepID=UPI003314BCDA